MVALSSSFFTSLLHGFGFCLFCFLAMFFILKDPSFQMESISLCIGFHCVCLSELECCTNMFLITVDTQG